MERIQQHGLLVSPNPYHQGMKNGIDQRTIQALVDDPTGITIINKYFENLLFFKVEEKDGFAVYMARIADQLISDGSKYVIAFVPLHLAVKVQAHLNELAWQNLQTRTVKQSYRIPAQRWSIPQGVPFLRFNLVSRHDTHTLYKSEQVPFELLMMHNEKKKTKFQYYPTIHLPAGLVSYGCVLHYIGDKHPLNVAVINDDFQLLS